MHRPVRSLCCALWILASVTAVAAEGPPASPDASVADAWASGGSVSIGYWLGEVTVNVGSILKTECTNGATHISICQGGSCYQASSLVCSPYNCEPFGPQPPSGGPVGLVCASSCKHDAECYTGAWCDQGRGQCAQWTRLCHDDFTVETPGGTETDCRPNRCMAGYCRSFCFSNNDCAPGYVCDWTPNGRRACKLGAP